MSLYKFRQNDIFYNRIKTYPSATFIVHNSQVYYNKEVLLTGSFPRPAETNYAKHVPGTGYVSLYELNIDRPNDGVIYPFITKDGSLNSFKTVTTSDYFDNSNVAYGDVIKGSYPMTASVTRYRMPEGDEVIAGEVQTESHKQRIVALKNTLEHYKYMSKHYAYEDTTIGWDKGYQELNLICIPSIFYGSSIKKRTVDLKFYITGTLVGQLQDEAGNGELIQTNPIGSNGSGSVAGVVLYNEGFVILTGSWDLTKNATAMGPAHTAPYVVGGTAESPAWVYFGSGMNDGLPSNTITQTSFDMSFAGTNYTPVVTMFAHAKKTELNYSNNPTYMKYQSAGYPTASTGSTYFIENPDMPIKNIVSSSYYPYTASFRKTTYISRIGIYDKDKNLIGVAKVATPVKKTEEREYTFKLKMDF